MGLWRRHPVLIGGLGALALGSAILLACVFASVSLPRPPDVRSAHVQTEAVLVDRHGEVLHEWRVDRSARRLGWVPLAEISPALQAAVIAAEDKRFYSHRGADWSSLAVALAGQFTSPRGASTITMQLAACIDADLRPSAARRSLAQKARQILAARGLERSWSKQEVFEAYLNLISFRGELQGIGAAAAGLFGKRPHGLDDLESVILASLIRAPNARSGQVAARAIQLAHTMQLPVQDSQVAAAAHKALDRPYRIEPETTLAPHVALRLMNSWAAAGSAPGRLVCTLDGDLQRFALDALRRQIGTISSQNVHDGAVLAVDNRTGEILAYVGNPGESASARHVDGVRARRQAGSTLKPVIYGLAFERRILTPASVLEDSPTDIPVPGGVYRPRNYDNRFHGLVTARTALASSLNVPAVKALGLVGVEPAIDQLGALGIENLQSADFYGPSLALGSLDVTLWELVNIYRTFANGGLKGEMRLSPSQPLTAPLQVLSREAAFLISDILSDRDSRAVTFTLESPLATSFWTAVKTGTSKDMRDNWCIGYSSDFTVGVWVGNFSGKPMWDVSGITGAAPAWLEVMNHLHREQPSRRPEPPPGVAAGDVTLLSGRRRREWFLSGTETRRVQQAFVHAPARIAYPAAGTVIALDPDIPEPQQKVFFQAEAGDRGLSWVLDGRVVGSAATAFLWTPSPGQHSLALTDAGHRVQDSISFEVRGTSLDSPRRENKTDTDPDEDKRSRTFPNG